MTAALVRLAWERPLTLAAWAGVVVYFGAHVFQAVDEIRTARFIRRSRQSPLLEDLRSDTRWRRWRLTETGHPEPDDDELARYIMGELDEERSELVAEWASISRRVADRLLLMTRAYEAVRDE